MKIENSKKEKQIVLLHRDPVNWEEQGLMDRALKSL